MHQIPTQKQFRATREVIRKHIVETPSFQWINRSVEETLGKEAEVFLKLELFQHSGTFKARGALANIAALSDAEKKLGVTAVSAGNHAIAVAYAANALGVSAKVVMQNTASPARIEAAERLGANVILEPPGKPAFEAAHRIANEEGRYFIHPFDGINTILGTGTLGLEIAETLPDLDAVIIAIGGGGLAAGVATVIKELQPNCKIYGVEPEGANIMSRSFENNAAQSTSTPNTIADSLAPPMTLPLPYELCRRAIERIVTVSDQQLCQAMYLLFREMKLAVEPAAAAATAALLGELAGEVHGKRVGVIICGANIDPQSFCDYIKRGSSTSDART